MSEDSKVDTSGEYQALGRRARNFFQVTFSDQSMRELNRHPVEEQLKLVDRISSFTADQLDHPDDALGKFHRGGKTFYRVRVNDLRCYFEISGDILYSHFILTKNSLMDFIYRNKLPVKDESLVEKETSFWQYLESLTK